MTPLDYISHSSQMTSFCEGPNSAKQGLAPACEVPLHFWRTAGARDPALLTRDPPLHSCAAGVGKELSYPSQ